MVEAGAGIFGALLLLAGQVEPVQGQVTLPLPEWEAMLDEVAAGEKKERPSIRAAPVSRKIRGTFRKGLLSAELTASFVVLDHEGHVRVPVLDADASLGEVLLDGKRTSLLREGAVYTVGVDSPGAHEVRLKFYWGKEQDRFTRRMRFRLPDSGPTEINITIPEVEIEGRLAGGALVSQRASAHETELRGQLDASGWFDLSWIRRLTHRRGTNARLEASVNTVLTIQEAIITGLSVFELSVQEGEIDRLELEVPPEIEVVRVEGDAVLQWRSETAKGGGLTVLFRFLVEQEARIAVHFQMPVEAQKLVVPKIPWTQPGTPTQGALGIRAPAGLSVEVVGAVAQAEVLSARDFPPVLTELSASPLLYAFTFSSPPAATLKVARHQEVALTSTLIDELQASTVVIESGTEITKLKLRIRNNTRQYLTMLLPAGSILTHSLIDGQPVRPALAPGQGDREALLIPLRQSERIGQDHERTHTVRAGETLSDIANFVYSDPRAWRKIVEGNRDQLDEAQDLQVGQVLKIPSRAGTLVEESSFVVELAYKRGRRPLWWIGSLDLELPELDVDSVGAIWHLYLPETFTPLAFEANLTQYSAIRYDPFRRLRDFFRRSMAEREVWAGGSYKNILSQRRGIWQAEAEKKAGAEVVLTNFPLTGERFKFRRILLGKETARVSVWFLHHHLELLFRWSIFLAAFVLAGTALSAARPDRRLWILLGTGLVLMLLSGHFVLGAHRRILWGVDLALLVSVVRPRLRPYFDRLLALVAQPWRLWDQVRFRNVVALLGLLFLAWWALLYPLLLSSSALVVLCLVRWRDHRRSGGLSHA